MVHKKNSWQSYAKPRGEFVFALFKPAIGRLPVGIGDPFSLPLAVLQTKKESELISKLLIRTLFAL